MGAMILGRAWTPEEDAALLRRWGELKAEGLSWTRIICRLSDELGRTFKAIKARRDHLSRRRGGLNRRSACCRKCGVPDAGFNQGGHRVGECGACSGCRKDEAAKQADPRPRVLLSVQYEDAKALGVGDDRPITVVVRTPAGDVEALALVSVLLANEPLHGDSSDG